MASPSFSASGSTLHTHNSPTGGQGFLRVFFGVVEILTWDMNILTAWINNKKETLRNIIFLYSQFQNETHVCTFKNIALKRLTFYL